MHHFTEKVTLGLKVLHTGRHLDFDPGPASDAPVAVESYPNHHPAPPGHQSQSEALPV